MKRFLQSLGACAFVLTLAAPASAGPSPGPTSMINNNAMSSHGSAATARPMNAMHPMSAGMSSTGKSMKSCGPGMKYVKGYTKSDGTKVHGYCRKS